MQVAAFFYGARALRARQTGRAGAGPAAGAHAVGAIVSGRHGGVEARRRVAAVIGRARRGQVRDVLGQRVLRADRGDAGVRGLAGLGEGVVAAVEVFALLRG